jgi:hypothetical protein
MVLPKRNSVVTFQVLMAASMKITASIIRASLIAPNTETASPKRRQIFCEITRRNLSEDSNLHIYILFMYNIFVR